MCEMCDQIEPGRGMDFTVRGKVFSVGATVEVVADRGLDGGVLFQGIVSAAREVAKAYQLDIHSLVDELIRESAVVFRGGNMGPQADPQAEFNELLELARKATMGKKGKKR